MAKYYRTRWRNMTIWKCLKCAFDSRNETSIIAHVASHSEVNRLASCIMPTYNRRQFVPTAVEAFLNQTYQDAELIVVDDGDSVEDLVQLTSQPVRYIRLNYRASIGMKRNIACQAARGNYIIHWDDDDFHHPHRVAIQVKALQRAIVCGLQEVWMGHPGDRFVKKTVGYDGWLMGASLAYHREAWRSFPFEDINLGEDTAFVSNFHPSQMEPIPCPWIVLVRNHPGNTSSRNPESLPMVEYKEL